jgi:hypothetical protein
MNRRSFFLTIAGLTELVTPKLRAINHKPSPSNLEKHPKGWIDLTPGPNLEGWTEYKWFSVAADAWKPTRQWHVNPSTGILLCDGLQPKSEHHSVILTDRQFGDSIYHVEFRFTQLSSLPGFSGYNSGVFVRMRPETPEVKIMHQVETGSDQRHAGFLGGGILDHGEVTVLDTKVFINDHWKRVNPGYPASWKQFVHRVEPRSDPKGLPLSYDIGIQAPVHPAGEWNTYEVTCRASTISVWTNGFNSSMADNCKVPVGSVGLESEGYRIEFRNLRIKELA